MKPVKDFDGKSNKYTDKDRKYTITAVIITTRRFGPSGSLKNKNINLENAKDVRAKITNEIVFDLKYIFVSISFRCSPEQDFIE